MKKIIITLVTIFNLLVLSSTGVLACTTIIVGKDASSNGSAFLVDAMTAQSL